MKEIKIGLIGSGGRAKVFKSAHRPEEGVRITACCDVDEAVFMKDKEAYGENLFVTTDYRTLLEQDLDAVVVGSPDWLHEEHACAALETGVAVFLEKPMDISIAGADHILQTAEDHDAKLFVGHNLRYMNLFVKMKSMIDSGLIGEVKAIWCRHFISYGGDAYFRDWHSERKHTNGLLLQKGVHDIDIMHWLAGRYTQKVSAFGSLSVYDQCPRRTSEEKGNAEWNPDHYPPLEQKGFSPQINVEDQNTVIMDMGDGVLGTYMQCHFSPDACRNYTVIGTKGRIENIGDGPDDPIYVWTQRKLEWEFHNRMLEPDDTRYGEQAVEGGHGGADPVMVQEFVEYIRGNRTHLTATPEAARMAIATACQATDSLRNGGGALEIPKMFEKENSL